MSLADLARDLRAPEVDRRLAAAWDTFDLGQRVADAAAFTEGADDIAALAAAASCVAGRELLPLPPGGTPHPLPHTTTVTADCADLLDQVAMVLDADARAASDPHLVAGLHAASDRARQAATGLRRTRGG